MMRLIKMIGRQLTNISNFICGKYRFWRGYPGMTAKEVALIRRLLASYQGKKIKVLEWGCGLSTIYYARYLRSLGIDFNWYGIDNSKEWFEAVQKRVKKSGLSDRVKLFLFEFVPFWLKAGWTPGLSNPQGFGPKDPNELQYIHYPASLGVKFDLIIVDARFRRRCLIEAQKILAPGGQVILHDAQKPHYQSPLGLFKYGGFIDSGMIYHGIHKTPCRLWIGSNDKPVFEPGGK